MVISVNDQFGHAGQDRSPAAERERVVGAGGHVVVAFGPLGFLLVQQGGVVRIGVLVGTGRRWPVSGLVDFGPDGVLAVALFSQEFR